LRGEAYTGRRLLSSRRQAERRGAVLRPAARAVMRWLQDRDPEGVFRVREDLPDRESRASLYRTQ